MWKHEKRGRGLQNFVVVVLFWDKVSVCSPRWPRTYYVEQAVLKLRLREVYMPLPTEIKGMGHLANWKFQCRFLFFNNSSGHISSSSESRHWQLTTICSTSPKGPDTLFWPLHQVCMWCTDMHTDKNINTHTINE